MPEQSGANYALTALFYECAFTAMANVGREEFIKHNNKVIFIRTDLRSKIKNKVAGSPGHSVNDIIVIFHKVNR